MNLFELVLYQSCNYKCRHCPMARWTYAPDEKFVDGHPKNAITNELLLPWMIKNLDPNEWIVDITGGEPGLYPWIKDLIPALAAEGYKGIVRINGSLYVPESPNFKRIAAWHEDHEFPKHYDFILILENPNDDWNAKKQYCIDNNIPHTVFPYTNYCSDGATTTTYPSKPTKLFRYMTTMFSSGALTGCFAGRADHTEASLHKDSDPVIFDFSECRSCGNVGAIEWFIYHAPGYKELFGITDDMELKSTDFTQKYPILTIDDKWVDENGKEWGVLGDDIDEINREYTRSKTKGLRGRAYGRSKEGI